MLVSNYPLIEQRAVDGSLLTIHKELTMTMKRRHLYFIDCPYLTSLDVNFGSGWIIGTPTKGKSSLIGLQATDSYINPMWIYFRNYGKYISADSGLRNFDRGNPFTTKRNFYSYSRFGVPISSNNTITESPQTGEDQFGGGLATYQRPNGNILRYNYTGRLFAKHDDQAGIAGNLFPSIDPINETEVNVLGTYAIRACTPTNPVANLANALGELKRDGLPLAPTLETWHQRTKRARDAGNEYLNVEFGWKPLLSDIWKTCHALKHSQKLIEEYVRNSGQKIHRSLEFPLQSSTTITDEGDQYPAPITLNSTMTTKGRRVKETIVTKRTWFEGSFTYYVEQGDYFLARAKRYEQLANKLLGTRLTPEVLYNLTPWSWALDWIVDLGAVIGNISAFLADGLILQYGYIMQETVISDIYTLTGATCGNRPVQLYQTLGTIQKLRRKATPYGFGLNPNAFSDRQWAILAALGLTLGGNKLAY